MPVHAQSISAQVGRAGVLPAETVGREVERALHSSSHGGLRRVCCKYANGEATLTGEVSSYYLKQMAQTIVGRFPQVQRVSNELSVARPQAIPPATARD